MEREISRNYEIKLVLYVLTQAADFIPIKSLSKKWTAVHFN